MFWQLYQWCLEQTWKPYCVKRGQNSSFFTVRKCTALGWKFSMFITVLQFSQVSASLRAESPFLPSRSGWDITLLSSGISAAVLMVVCRFSGSVKVGGVVGVWVVGVIGEGGRCIIRWGPNPMLMISPGGCGLWVRWVINSCQEVSYRKRFDKYRLIRQEISHIRFQASDTNMITLLRSWLYFPYFLNGPVKVHFMS